MNLMVILLNGGWMPLSISVAHDLSPNISVNDLVIGTRFGTSKDMLLDPEGIRLAWLSDRFLTPNWFPLRYAFSLGDVLIGLGAYWFLSTNHEGRNAPFLMVFRRIRATSMSLREDKKS